MNILLTGAAGFIGSHVADRLIAEGHTVIAVDNFSAYYNPQYKESNIEAHAETAVYQLVRADITDAAAMRAVFEQHSIDLIIHLAAQAGVRISIEQPLLTQRVNVEGTYLLFELAREFGVHDIIFASSSSVYGNQNKTPFSEEANVDHPISPYAASKRACELIAYTYHHLYQMNCIGLRFFTVYGERGRPDMSPYKFTESLLYGKPIQLYGDGSAERDFTYIDDIVDGVMACVGKKLEYEIINLGNSHPLTMREYIAVLERVTGKEAKIEYLPAAAGDMNKTYADISKASRLLNWRPKTDIETGLKKFVHWFTEERFHGK
ncbi:MAG: GDP-mannose 4,6-dehydratase [Candidatus Kerfeldbacteria bacterium]|nr:GDP-mannose 4,6-dehydratase [Candidatus Kerfeldbacteria bacterium]